MSIAGANGSQALHVCQALAQKYHIMIRMDGLLTKQDQQFSSHVFNEDGELLTTYDKVHLFGLMREDEFLTPSNAQGSFRGKGDTCSNRDLLRHSFSEWFTVFIAIRQPDYFRPSLSGQHRGYRSGEHY